MNANQGTRYEDFWEPMTTGQAVAVLGGMVVVLACRSFTADGFVPVLDWANAVFHEAGHAILGLAGPEPRLVGGLVGQLAFPLLTTLLYWRHRGTTGFALCAIWLCENVLLVARAMGGATPELPLMEGREHDFPRLLESWNLVERQAELVSRAHLVAMAGLFAVAAWTCWRWTRDRLAAEPDANAEESPTRGFRA